MSFKRIYSFPSRVLSRSGKKKPPKIQKSTSQSIKIVKYGHYRGDITVAPKILASCYLRSDIELIWHWFPMSHCGLECQIWSGQGFWGYNGQIWHLSIPLVFLGIKDFMKNVKGRQRSKRPNQRPESQNCWSFRFFGSLGLIWC